jgi:hypothetical protein
MAPVQGAIIALFAGELLPPYAKQKVSDHHNPGTVLRNRKPLLAEEVRATGNGMRRYGTRNGDSRTPLPDMGSGRIQQVYYRQ